MIEGVRIHPLRQIPDERGRIMPMLRADDLHFERFGEIYFSLVYPGVVKAWHLHHRVALNYAVPWGLVKLVLYDDRPGSSTRGTVQEVFLGEGNYALVHIPPMVWNGFKGVGVAPALVANCADLPHDPDEMERQAPSSTSVPYDWGLRHG